MYTARGAQQTLFFWRDSVMVNDFIEVTPEKLGGTPVFRGTRIPVRVLFDYLEESYTVDAFLEQYEIDPNLVHGFIEALRDSFTTDRKAEV
ncbi:uncharacterized protein (DUF433 family) [Salinibacter ruber]|jgi:uncharacterized protein (DUF433 family)|nr:DUF433 domain-containing protein [Salinibacter ruber]MBB4060800.1 uncharacterized protein (DUF433 family) [Salinibacter ruber]MBB4068838.1 uncharacterized protein (DUF433 family) [Salinibacter ruber]MCS3671412.1 uncharacterized protein (DUF433 family) [Salinibacter ruber]MCS3710080.1 uncharacterized protein (DUF433 family) [Salinibacter ruber]MCS3752153.1 uncharacterized protein (DUF433 family) [Salinibacter ruber]